MAMTITLIIDDDDALRCVPGRALRHPARCATGRRGSSAAHREDPGV
jgi:hypothetical protein